MNIGNIIKEAGMKATPQRKMIYQIMSELGHSTLDDIVARVQEISPEMTLSTVYRILDTFCKTGLVSKLSLPGGKCFYDITTWDHPHVFKGNEITDYIDHELNALIINHLKNKSFKQFNSIKNISLQIVIDN